MADMDAAFDEQDQSEVFDEDNTNDVDRGPGEEREQLEDLLEVYDVTTAVGDADEDEARIGEELDDEEIVAASIDNGDDDDDLEDGDFVRREEASFARDDDLDDAPRLDGEDFDDVDEIAALAADEVDLEYVGDLNDLAGAASAAQMLEASSLSDDDLTELDYKDGDARA